MKKKIIYEEDIFFGEFRVRQPAEMMVWYYPYPPDRIPIILTGWVKDETHIQWMHQSLN